MGDCTKKSKRIAGALEMEEEASGTNLTPKRTKFSTCQQLKESKPSTTTNDVVVVSTHKKMTSSSSGFVFSDEFSASRCSSNVSLEIVKHSLIFADLEVTSFETEVSTCNNNNKFSRETSPLSEICGDSEETSSMDHSPPKNQPPESRRRRSPEGTKMPTAAEIDDFFSAAEKNEQKRFTEKYNYDIVKDVALEGRYQWVRLKPN
ncbi:hypothetical protein Ddye_003688 [Dipteronia dyeriana]|uniref:Cyclin-dependent kinase inhibitor n=1 Tax=Dipteronia dyeriana TaxID=168575 RepID=A0AAD9XSS0_9ROSI|nr:hypothetical protein Ddye_003688 [Dipteronia dyeriana]